MHPAPTPTPQEKADITGDFKVRLRQPFSGGWKTPTTYNCFNLGCLFPGHAVQQILVESNANFLLMSQVSLASQVFNGPKSLNKNKTSCHVSKQCAQSVFAEITSKLVFYTQSTSAVIPGRCWNYSSNKNTILQQKTSCLGGFLHLYCIRHPHVLTSWYMHKTSKISHLLAHA